MTGEGRGKYDAVSTGTTQASQVKKVKVILVFPPAADPSLPYASLPYLAASLRGRGCEEVAQKDLNLETFLHLLTADELRRAAGDAEAALASGGLSEGKAVESRKALADAESTIAGIAEAISILRDPVRFYEPEALLYAKRAFNSACRLLSAGFEHFSFGKYSYSRHELRSAEEVGRAAEEEGENPVVRFFREKGVPGIAAEKPDLVGITIPYFQQLVPGLILSRAIKEQSPETFVCLGGPIVSWGKEALMRYGVDWALDGFFVGEGDSALAVLVEELGGARRLDRVPNFVLLEGGKAQDFSAPPRCEDLDLLPTPAYEELPLSDYLAPKRVISLSLSKGCYWNRCKFCNYSFIKLGPYRFRDPALSVADVAEIVERTGEDVFCFESDVIHPDDLASFARELISEGVRIKWHGVIRFEESVDEELCGLLAEAGCVRLYAGLESACQRLLDLMDKGTTVPVIEEVLKACDKGGIAVEAGVFFGFPTETRAEAKQTVEFFRRHRKEIARSDAGTFRLLRGSPISEEPSKYGIVVADVYEERWFELSYEHMEDPGKGYSKEAMGEVERLYPAIKLIDIPEEILLIAKLGKEALDEFAPA